jgi:hypothetical protein
MGTPDGLPRWFDERLAQASFEGSYLLPLVHKVRSHDEDIRRQAICALANLSSDSLRGENTDSLRLAVLILSLSATTELLLM